MTFNEDEVAAFLLGVWTPCVSSNVAGIQFDEEREILHVQFKKSNTIYSYRGCSWDIALDFARAPSKGRWVDKNIVKAGWDYESKFSPL